MTEQLKTQAKAVLENDLMWKAQYDVMHAEQVQQGAMETTIDQHLNACLEGEATTLDDAVKLGLLTAENIAKDRMSVYRANYSA